jgi:hypothetical protein
VLPGQRDGSLLWYRELPTFWSQSLTWRSTPHTTHTLAFWNQKMDLAW